MNKIEIELNGEKVLLDVDRARELGLIGSVKKDLIKRREDERYYIINSSYIAEEDIDKSEKWDNERYNNGQYFSSKEVAQSYIDQLGGLTGKIQTYILEENAKRGFVANWNDGNQKKFYICCDNSDKKYSYHYKVRINKHIGGIYTSEDIAKDLTDKLNNGWR